MDVLDILVRSKNYQAIDTLILNLQVEHWPSTPLLTLLIETKKIEDHLPSHKDFYNRCKVLFNNRGQTDPRIFANLHPYPETLKYEPFMGINLMDMFGMPIKIDPKYAPQ